MELQESTFLASDYTTKLQSSREYGTGTRTHTHTHTKQKYIAMKQNRKPRDKSTHPQTPYL